MFFSSDYQFYNVLFENGILCLLLTRTWAIGSDTWPRGHLECRHDGAISEVTEADRVNPLTWGTHWSGHRSRAAPLTLRSATCVMIVSSLCRWSPAPGNHAGRVTTRHRLFSVGINCFIIGPLSTESSHVSPDHLSSRSCLLIGATVNFKGPLMYTVYCMLLPLRDSLIVYHWLCINARHNMPAHSDKHRSFCSNKIVLIFRPMKSKLQNSTAMLL